MNVKHLILSSGIAAGAYILGHRTGFKRCAEKVLAVVNGIHDPKVKGNTNNEAIFATRSEAEGVLDSMVEIIDRYGFVTLSDLKDLSGVDTTFKDNTLGWTNIKNSCIKKQIGGYILVLEQPMNLQLLGGEK